MNDVDSARRTDATDGYVRKKKRNRGRKTKS
jgi:hypothetical protein